MKKINKQKGFTLLELIVSSVIIVFLGLTGLRALTTALAIRDDVTTRHVTLREFELTTAIIRRDFNNIQRFPLPKKDNFNEDKLQRVIDVNPTPGLLLSFYVTANPTLRQSMRKIELTVKDKSLIRREFDLENEKSIDTVLLKNIEKARAEAEFPKIKPGSLTEQTIMPNTVTIWFIHPKYGELNLKHAFL